MNTSPSWPPGPATPGPDPFDSPVQRAGDALQPRTPSPPDALPNPDLPQYPEPRYPPARLPDGYHTGGFPGASQYEPQFSGQQYEPRSSGLGRWTRFSALALVALALSLASLRCIWPAPIGLILGIVALRHVRREGSKGQAVAIAGVTIGGVISFLLLIAIVLEFVNPDSADAAAILAP